MKSSDQFGIAELRGLCDALGKNMREAANAIATHDLHALEAAVRGQQQLADLMVERRAAFATLAQEDPQTLTDLARQNCTLSRILHRSSLTHRGLLSLAKSENDLYSLATLPRR